MYLHVGDGGTLAHPGGMSTESVFYEALPDVDDSLVELEPEGAVESFDVMRGILVGVMLCLPFWAGLYFFLRSL